MPAHRFILTGDVDKSGAIYLVQPGRCVQFIPTGAWQGVYARAGLVDLKTAPTQHNGVQFEWLMKQVLAAGGSVGCPAGCAVCVFAPGKRWATWADVRDADSVEGKVGPGGELQAPCTGMTSVEITGTDPDLISEIGEANGAGVRSKPVNWDPYYEDNRLKLNHIPLHGASPLRPDTRYMYVTRVESADPTAALTVRCYRA